MLAGGVWPHHELVAIPAGNTGHAHHVANRDRKLCHLHEIRIAPIQLPQRSRSLDGRHGLRRPRPR